MELGFPVASTRAAEDSSDDEGDNSPGLNSLFVELTETFQKELCERIKSFIRDDKKHRSLWNRFVRWLASIRRLNCICGASGVGCECERPPPQPLPPARLPVRAESPVRTLRRSTSLPGASELRRVTVI